MTLAKEHRQVLDLLAEGKITADEAQQLLEKLNGSRPVGGSEATPTSGSNAAVAARSSTTAVLVAAPARPGSGTGRSAPRYLRILVHTNDGDDVNIRVPLQIVRAGLKLTTVLPKEAREKLRESGVDLSSLNELEGEALIDALRELSIDVESSDGDVVRIFCE